MTIVTDVNIDQAAAAGVTMTVSQSAVDVAALIDEVVQSNKRMLSLTYAAGFSQAGTVKVINVDYITYLQERTV